MEEDGTESSHILAGQGRRRKDKGEEASVNVIQYRGVYPQLLHH